MVESFPHDPSLGSRTTFGRSFVKGNLDGLCRGWASGGGALAKYFLTCLHVERGGLSMVTGIEHRYALVNGVLNDFVGLAGFARGFLAVTRDQDGVDNVNDSV